MAQLILKRGNYAGLENLAISDGQLIFVKDTNSIYADIGTERIKFSDVVQVATSSALPANGNAGQICIVSDINALGFWNGTGWTQLNVDTGATSIEVVGDGNAVTAASYDATTRKLTLTKGATFATKAEHDGVDARLAAAEKKLESVATTEGLGELAETVGEHTVAIDTINGDVETAGSMLKIAKDAADSKDAAIKEAKDAADKAQGDVDALAQTHADDKEALEGSIALKANIADVYDKDAIDGMVETINGAIDAKAAADSVYTKTQIDGKVETLEAADEAITNLIGDVTEGKTVVEMIEAAQTAATYDDEEVRGLISDNADAIAQEVEDREGAVSGLKSELEGKINTKVEQETYNAKVGELAAKDEELAGLIEANETAIANETAARESAVSGLKTDLEAAIALKADNTALEAEKTAREEAVEGLQTQINTIMNNPDAEGAINSINEFTAYVASHGTIADGFRADIDQNKADIAAEVKRAGEAESALSGRLDTLEAIDHDAYVAADTALKTELEGKINLKAAQADLEAMGTRVGTLETNSATKDELKVVSDNLAAYEEEHAGDYTNTQIDAKVKGVQDQIDALDDTYATDAELAQAIADEVARANGAYAAKTLESTVSTHVADEVAHITADERTAWNGAVSDLATHKAAYDTKVAALEAEDAAIRTAFAAADGALKTELQGYADQAELDAIAAAKLETESQVGAEKTAREQAVAGVQTAIDTINNAETGILAQAKSDATSKANTAESNAKSYVDGLLTWEEF